MSTFDPDAYFARKLEGASATDDKLLSLAAASQRKAIALEAYAPVAEARREQFKAQKAADDASWVGRAGLDPNSALGEVVGKIADFTAGGSRQVVGTTAALPANLASQKINADMSQDDITAYNNYVEGKATPAELERLNRVPGMAEQLTNAAITAGKGLSKGMIDPAGFSLDASTKLDKFKAAEQLNQQARKTTDLFDISSIQHTAGKRGLDEALGADFQANWDKVKGVFNDPANATYMANAPTTGLSERGNIPLEGMKYAPGAMETVDTIDGTFVVPAGKDAKAKFGESMQHFGKFKDQESATNYIQQLNKQAVESKDQFVELGAKGNTKDAMDRAGEIVSGMAGLLSSAGRAAMDNKSGVASYVAENLPQLAVGAFGPAGHTLMTASNVGYAADNYQKGLENYAKANNGKLPSRDEQDYMARMAATLAVAEQLGDSLSLGVSKVVGKAGKSRVLNAAKAAVAGGIGETATEGYQTYGEGEATGKPATAEDIYKGAVIGGLSGGALTGGMAFLHTPARARDAQGENQSESQLKEFAAAAEKNDPTPFTDKTKATYDPAKGVGVLLQHALRPDATPEIKAKNLESATEIVSQMEDAVTKAQELVDTRSPAEIARYEKMREDTTAELAATPETDVAKRAELTDTLAAVNEQLIDSNDKKQALRDNTKLSKLTRQLEDGRNRLQALADIVATPTSTQEVTDIVDQIKAPAADVTPEAKAKAIDSVINLSMTNPDSLSSKQADDLANDTNNGLTDEQRKHLRAFSAARVAENKMNDIEGVSATVFYGDKKNVGISQYRARIAGALQAGNQKVATTQLNMLQKFADDHSSKATAARQAMRQGMGNQIVKLTDGSGWMVLPKGQKLDSETMDKNGALTIVSARLVDNIAKEAAALNATVSEMNSAMGLKFGVQSGSLQTVPEKNNTTKKMVEGEARPVETTELIPKEEVKKSPIISETVSSPSALPASPAVAGAPAATASPLATETQTSTTAKPVAVQQPAVVSEASKAPVADTAKVEAVEKKTTLKAFDTQIDPAAPYTKQNLVATQFTQEAGNPATGTVRPLASVPDFASALENKTVKVSDFTQQKEDFSPEQRIVVSTFLRTLKEWTPIIEANLVKGNEGYGFEDMIQFLLDENINTDENVKTAMAYAAFTTIADLATRPTANTNADINMILGKPETALVSKEARQVLELAGIRQTVMDNAFGQLAVQALGLKPKADAPLNVQSDLEASIGAHITKMLLDAGVLVRSTIPGAKMAVLTGSTETSSNADFYFVKLAEVDGRNSPKVTSIYEATIGTKGMLDKLFGVESAMKEPSTTPIKSTQKTTRNTDQAIPTELKEMVAKDDAEASHVRLDMFNLATQVAPETMLEIAGFEEVDVDTVHVSRRKSMEAKNNGLVRELNNFMDYVGRVGTDLPMYFEHSVWKQQRVGIATNLINPQTSKIHRHMLYRSAWETKIDTTNSVEMENFKLRVAEGLGVKTDKKSREKALAEYSALVASPEIKGAVAVLVKTLSDETGGQLSGNDQLVLLSGVKAGGTNMHSLDALMALAQATKAVRDGQTTFTTQMMAEVDGVTNGPMLSNLLLGASNTVAGMYDLLNRGGFYQVDSGFKDYNNWRATPGKLDLYETTALHMTQAVVAAGYNTDVMDAMYAFTGELADKDTGNVTKAGRNIIKTPVTEVHFGSSVNNTVDSMADNFIDAIYGTFEDSAKDDGMLEHEILAHLKELGVNLPAGTKLLDYEFNAAEVKQLKFMFTETLGASVKTVMEADFEVYINQRTQFNLTAQLSYSIFNAAYTGLREQMMTKLIAEGKIATNPTTGKPLHDMTAKQHKELMKQVEALVPVAQTPMSEASGELNAGLLVSKSDRNLSTDPAYQNTVKFGKPFKDNGSKSYSARGYQVNYTSPGVAMVPMMMHSADSAISVRANKDAKALNAHDAQGFGVGGIVQTAINMNQATWETMLAYSPATQITDTLLRTIHGFDALVTQGVMPDTVYDLLASSLVDIAEKNESSPEGVLAVTAALAKDMAFRADYMKLDTLATMESVNQYAMENGAYAVTADDRSSAESLRSSLEVGLSADDRLAVNRVSDKLDAAIGREVARREKAKVKTKADPDMDAKIKPAGSVAELGKSAVKSDPVLVKAFSEKPTMTLAEVAAVLRPNLKGEFNQRLLSVLERSTGTDLVVKYVTSKTAPESILDKGGDKSRGWYVSKDGKQEIYVLAPEFKYSGLTAETLLHELTHASVARTIEQAQIDGKGDAFALVQELESLREAAADYIKANKLEGQFAPAVTNVHELVSWGMSNTNFQNLVLNKISVPSVTGGNKLVVAMQAFIDKLTGLIFGRHKANMANGLKVLISNTSGLFYAAAQTKTTSPSITLDMVQQVPNLRNLTTLDIHEALNNINNNGVQVSAEHDVRLREMLSNMVSKLYGPYGSFKADMMEQTAQTPDQVYQEALITGKAPYAQEASLAGFALTEQEEFAMEQVQSVVAEAISGKDGTTAQAYRELSKLYDDVRSKVTVQNFIKAANPTAVELAEAQALYDFMFKLPASVDGKSEYLSRFAGLAMAHEATHNMLAALNTKSAPSTGTKTFNDRLSAIINSILNWFGGKFTNTYSGQPNDAKLASLVQQMIKIEAKKRAKLEAQVLKNMQPENFVDKLSGKASKKLAEFAAHPFFKTNSNPFIKAIGSIATVVAKDQSDAVMEAIQKIRDQNFGNQQQGLLAATVAEVRGSHAGNLMYLFLLRASKHIEGIRKDIITGTGRVVMNAFDQGGKNLTSDQKNAISAVFLRTDMSSLLGQYSVADLTAMLGSDAKVQVEINAVEAKLAALPKTAAFRHYYSKSAKALGYRLVTGVITNANMMMNAHNIANLYGTPYQTRVNQMDALTAVPLLDSLVSLYAMKYTRDDHRGLVLEVLQAEKNRTDGGNGVEMLLMMHARLAEDSRKKLFDGNEALYMKGYTSEIYDPYMSVKIANESEGAELVLQGYKQGALVGQDKAEPASEPHHIYSLRDGGLSRRVTGTMSFTGTAAKGSRVHSGNLSGNSYAGQYNASTMAAIASNKRAEIAAMFRPHHFDPTSVEESYMAPLVNANGDVANYRYMMEEHTKNVLLNRDNRPDKLLGTMAGSTFDKVESPKQNRRVVEALHDQFVADFAVNPAGFLNVGPKSTDPQLREIWRLLPEKTKQDVRAVWGTEGMRVKAEVLDMNFGYKKLSVSDAFDTEATQRSLLSTMFVLAMSYAFDEKAKLRASQAEEVWQEVVKATKGNFVVRSFSTLAGNFRSNVSQLLLSGVNPQAIIKGHVTAFKGAWAYKKDSAKMAELAMYKATGYTGHGLTAAELDNQIARLQDSINRNPIKPLLDAGLMPTIVEDIDTEDDLYSYKSRGVKKVTELTDKLNPNISKLGGFLLMAEGSKPYQIMSYATQISDFLARFVLYEHLTTKRDAMTHEEATQRASDAFINYDVPTHRKLQYANDSGLVMFTKYYLRIQKMLVRLYREHPGRVMAMIAAEKFLIGNQPTVLDSSMMNRLGNPINLGALDYPGSLDSLATVRILTSPFSGGGNPTE
jgi:hypothetical protein